MALGQGQTDLLANSLLIAFDTTVVGLISASICVVLARLRKKWNADYANALEACEATLLDRIDALAAAGDLDYTAPMALEADKADGKGESSEGKEAEDAEEAE